MHSSGCAHAVSVTQESLRVLAARLRIQQATLLVESQTLRFGFALLLEADLYALHRD